MVSDYSELLLAPLSRLLEFPMGIGTLKRITAPPSDDIDRLNILKSRFCISSIFKKKQTLYPRFNHYPPPFSSNDRLASPFWRSFERRRMDFVGFPAIFCHISRPLAIAMIRAALCRLRRRGSLQGVGKVGDPALWSPTTRPHTKKAVSVRREHIRTIGSNYSFLFRKSA